MAEAILEPELPIVDPHHHLWDAPRPRYLLDEVLGDSRTGHNIVGSVFVECRAMYRATGEEELKSLGETQFAGGIAAMSESGAYGTTRVCEGLVGYVDLRLGARAGSVLEKHLAVSDGRLRGIRNIVASRTLKASDYPRLTLTADAERTVTELKASPGKDIAIFGGGDLFRSLLAAGLVDRIEVAIIPVLLGGGIPLLPPPAGRAVLALRSQRLYEKTGIVAVEYDVLRKG